MRGSNHSNSFGRPHLAGSVNRNPLRKIVDYTEDSHGVTLEVLECGHRQPPRHDMIGETSAARRRCWRCGRDQKAVEDQR